MVCAEQTAFSNRVGSNAKAFWVRLLGQLSNLSASLEAIFEAMPDTPLQPIDRPESPPGVGNGVVKRAVVKVLAAAGAPMRGADVYRAVERLLGASRLQELGELVSGARRNEMLLFERVGYGMYRLRRR